MPFLVMQYLGICRMPFAVFKMQLFNETIVYTIYVHGNQIQGYSTDPIFSAFTSTERIEIWKS